MNTDELKREILAGIKSNKDLLLLRNIIVEFHKDGGKREDAENSLMSLIRGQDILTDEEDDLLREVMDFVYGWCQPKYRIWPEKES